MKSLYLLLTEALSEDERKIHSLPSYEEISSNEGGEQMATLYRVAFKYQLDNIFKNGYSRDFTGSKGGNMYGPGVYCTFKLSDSIHNVETKPEYGDCIVMMKLVGGYKDFLIFDRNMAMSVYGEQWRIRQQLMTITGLDSDTCSRIEAECSKQQGSLYHGRTAPAAFYIWSKYRDSLYQKYGIRGIVYKGNRDGHCALPYDFTSVIPYAVSFDKGKTFQRRFNRDLYDNLKEHPDTKFRYGGDYHQVFRAVKGFTLVQNDNGKYNIIAPSTHSPISPVWFDDMKGSINPSDGTFGFTYSGIDFNGSIYSPEGAEGIGCVLDPYGEPYCEFSDLKELADDIRSCGARTFMEYAEMDEDNGANESHAHADVLSINEERAVGENGVVTIDNFEEVKKLMEPSSNDDVWFVQVIKRHKDNPDQYFARNACEYIAYYLLHDANELMEKRDEIISVCRATNSRAYIYPNKRSLVSLSDYANNVLRRRFEKYHDKFRRGHEIEVAAGQSKDWPERKLCFLDIDSDDEQVYMKVMEILKNHGITPIWEYRSLNNGWHILLPDKEQARNIDFSIIDNGNRFGRFSTVGLEIDKPLLLYASLIPNGYQLQQRVQQQKLRRRR